VLGCSWQFMHLRRCRCSMFCIYHAQASRLCAWSCFKMRRKAMRQHRTTFGASSHCQGARLLWAWLCSKRCATGVDLLQTLLRWVCGCVWLDVQYMRRWWMKRYVRHSCCMGQHKVHAAGSVQPQWCHLWCFWFCVAHRTHASVTKCSRKLCAHLVPCRTQTIL
jgi:hypothetical protein